MLCAHLGSPTALAHVRVGLIWSIDCHRRQPAKMSSLKASLKSAKESLARGAPKDALQHCKAALKADKSSYEAYL